MLKVSDTAAFVLTSRIQKLRDVYRYTCYSIISDYKVPVSEISDPLARETLENLDISEVPLVTRILAYNTHHLPALFGLAVKIKVKEYHNDQPSFAIAHYHNAVNQFRTAQNFCDNAVYIKKLEKCRLYYLGARWNDNEQKYTVIRMYLPLQQTTQKLRYHMNIIYQLQKVLSEKEYKDLKDTLKLRFAGEDIEMTFYHAFSDEIVTSRFDFFNQRTQTCTEFRSFFEKGYSPVDFILNLYYTTKAYKQNNTELLNALVSSTSRTLR